VLDGLAATVPGDRDRRPAAATRRWLHGADLAS
jgi:hypothetical protein